MTLFERFRFQWLLLRDMFVVASIFGLGFLAGWLV